MNRNILYLLPLAAGLVLFFGSCAEEGSVTVSNLRCEQLVNPQGIDVTEPRLSWEIHSDTRAVKQRSYRVLIASSLEKLGRDEGDIWDSGNVRSDASVQVPYGGRPLESRDVCFWKVKVSTNRGSTQWSAPATWTMGLLRESDWQARWTGLDRMFPGDVFDKSNSRLAARYFRTEFAAADKPVKATLYLSGLGLYHLYINGEKIGDQQLAPTPTDYSRSVKYNTFDVTGVVREGGNAIATVLGNGRFFSMRPPGIDHHLVKEVRHFGYPKMILQLELTYPDGTTQVIVSDDNWKVTADGPVMANNEFDGEEYDARRELTGWNDTGYDDSRWLRAETVEAPGGRLEAQLNPNIRIMEVLKPKSVSSPGDGTYILDMGQNMVGWVSMKARGKSGDRITLRFAEALNGDGSLYMDNIRAALVTDVYTMKGGAVEQWEPQFVYHGFRYVEIKGYPGTPTVDDFEGKVVYDEMELTGSFETSDSTLNRIYRNAYWGIRGNYRGMPTDCPQRDERMGWLGDRAAGSHGESFIFSNQHLYAKWLDDIEQSQLDNGSVPDVAPNYWDFYSDNMTWPGAYLTMANMLYEQFGDERPIVKHYPSMKKWMAYMRDTYMEGYIMPKDIYGDWCMPPEEPWMIHAADPARRTDGALLGTAFYYRMLTLLEKFALLQGLTDEAAQFAAEAVHVKNAYSERFFDGAAARYGNNTVTGNLLSLCFGMVPEGYEDAVFDNIVRKTEDDFDSHVSTGLVGIQWLMRGLSDHGRPDLAYMIATNRDYPSWGYMIEQGATTIWELWNGDTADPAMNSHNHVMLLGDLIIWFYEYLGGIRNDPAGAGFVQVVMRPYPVDGLDYVNASYRSVRGTIKSSWRKENGSFLWDITVPGNCTAKVYVPANDGVSITESGAKAASAKGVKYLGREDGYALYEVGSGDYSFAVR